MTFTERDVTQEDSANVQEWGERLEQLDHIYRYIGVRGERFAWFYDLALRSLLHFPPYAKLNDPFDGSVQFIYGGTEQEIRAFWKGRISEHGKALDSEALAKIQGFVDGRDDPAVHKQMRDIQAEETAKLGVACFSETPDDLPMWGYYADAHQGVCLRFRAPLLLGWEDCTPPMPVTYDDDYPKVAFYRDSRSRRGGAVMATKAKVWCHEREWRIVRRAGGGSVPFNPAALDGVIMGCMMSDEDEARVKDVRARRTPHVELLKVHMAERSFKLVIRPA